MGELGERTLRRLLIVGSTAVLLQASKRGAPAGSNSASNATSSRRVGIGLILRSETLLIQQLSQEFKGSSLVPGFLHEDVTLVGNLSDARALVAKLPALETS